jgi:hypothetical protein
VTGGAQLISGGDAHNSAANDDDIHVCFDFPVERGLTGVPRMRDMRRVQRTAAPIW